MKNLIFLYDKLINKVYREKLLLPIHFVTYGFINAKLYEYYDMNEYRVIAVENDNVVRTWGNDKVFGGIFLLDYFNVKIRELDAFYACSKSRLNKNNKNDLMHRKVTEVTPIAFETLEDLAVMKYVQRDSVLINAYLGNPNHKWINHRIKANKYRVIDGIDIENFKELFKQEGRG